MNVQRAIGLLEANEFGAIAEALRQRHAPQPLTADSTLTMVCMDTRPGDPNCAYLANDHALDLARHPGGLSGASRRASGAWAADAPEEYLEYSEAAHMNGLRLIEPLGELGVDAVIHFGCRDNEVAQEAAALVADRDEGIFEIAEDMTRGKLTRREYGRIADGQSIMLDAGHIALPSVIIEDYERNGVPIARLHGDELRGLSLVDNRSRHPIRAMPKRHNPNHDNAAIYVTDTGLVIPKLVRAARLGLSAQIRPSTVSTMDTVHKATLIKLLDIPYVTVE